MKSQFTQAFLNQNYEQAQNVFGGIKSSILESVDEDDRSKFEQSTQDIVRRSSMDFAKKRNSLLADDTKSIFLGKPSDDNNKYRVLKHLLRYFIPNAIGDDESKYIDTLISNFCAGDGYRRMELLGDALLNAKLVEVCLATYDYDHTVKILPTIRSNAFYDCFVADLCSYEISSASDLLEITVGILSSNGYDYSMVALELKCFHEMKGRRKTIVEFNAKSKLWEFVAQRGFCTVHSNFSVDVKSKNFLCTTTFFDNKRNYDGYGESSVKKEAEQKACLEVLRLLFLSGQPLPKDVIQSLGYERTKNEDRV